MPRTKRSDSNLECQLQEATHKPFLWSSSANLHRNSLGCYRSCLYAIRKPYNLQMFIQGIKPNIIPHTKFLDFQILPVLVNRSSLTSLSLSLAWLLYDLYSYCQSIAASIKTSYITEGACTNTNLSWESFFKLGFCSFLTVLNISPHIQILFCLTIFSCAVNYCILK